MARQIKSVRVNWDSQDTNNEGWAYLATFSDNHQESGEVNDLVANASVSELMAKAEEIAEGFGGEGGEVNTLGMGNGCEWVAN
jgi:hypothetical protein